MIKSKVLCKAEYKGLIDGEFKHLQEGEELLMSPDMAIKLVAHYEKYFEVIGSEKVKPKKKEEDSEKKKVVEYENKMADLYNEK